MPRKTLLFIVVGAILLAGIFYLTSKKTAVPADDSGVKEQVFELKVEKARIVSGENILKGYEGDRLTLRVTSDTDDELHLHGYDLTTPLRAGIPAEISFMADKTGRFSLELHGKEAEIGAFEIFPR